MAEIIYGRNAVTEALRVHGRVEEVLLIAGIEHPKLSQIKRQAHSSGIPVKVLSKASLADLVGDAKTQGVAARVRATQTSSIAEMIMKAERSNEPPLIALLDGIEDPHNMGAILRSADAAGLHGVVLPKKRSVGITATVVKISAGASAHVLTSQVSNLNNAIKELQGRNIWIVGADQDANVDFTEADLTDPLGVVIGAEGKGLHRLVRENCDFLVRIPMYGKINSLNASVAAALLFYEIRRQRTQMLLDPQ